MPHVIEHVVGGKPVTVTLHHSVAIWVDGRPRALNISHTTQRLCDVFFQPHHRQFGVHLTGNEKLSTGAGTEHFMTLEEAVTFAREELRHYRPRKRSPKETAGFPPGVGLTLPA